MELNKIKNSGTWGDAVTDLNYNFTKVDSEVVKLHNATTHHKGYFNTAAELTAMFPSGSTNDMAYVGPSYPFYIYKWDGSAWYNTGSTGGSETIALNSYTTTESITDTTDYADVF